MIAIRAHIAVVVAALFSVTGSFAQTVSFGAATNFPAGYFTNSVVAGDFDGDGKLDLAVTNGSGASNSVSIFLNTGGGSFGPATNVTVGSGPNSIAIGDFTGDGQPDLAVSNGGSNNVSILLNAGGGTFVAVATFSVGTNPNAVAIGDLNGDGKPDLAVSNGYSNSVGILLNTFTGLGAFGASAFSAPTNIAVGGVPSSIAIGDLNRDGKLDLAVSNYEDHNVSVLLNAGAGVFGPGATFAVGFFPVSVAIADLNDDGALDLAVSNSHFSSDSVSILLNTGTGSFGVATNFTVGSGFPQTFVAIGDLNGDGKPDLVVGHGNANTNVSILLNAGAGSFSGPTNVTTAGEWTASAAIADLDGDGRPDLAVANLQFPAGVSVLLNTTAFDPAGTYGPATNFGAGTRPVSLAIGDVNANGKPDLVVANVGSNNVSRLLNTGVGAFGAATNFALGAPPNAVAIDDLNGDGRLDLAVAENFVSSRASILLNTGAGAFGGATSFAAGLDPRAVAIGDLNHDGKPDLAVANAIDNTVSVHLNTGLGTFGPATNFPAGITPTSVAIGDLNRDGYPDLAVTNEGNNTVSVFLGTGTGSFDPATNFLVGFLPSSVAIGDLNADGRPDLAVANSFSNSVSILLGSTGTNCIPASDAAFCLATSFPVATTPRSLAIGDLNRDGMPDLAVANSGSNNVSILRNTGGGAFGPATNLAVGSRPRSIAIGDLNRDGRLDLAVANELDNNVSVLLNGASPAQTIESLISFIIGMGGHRDLVPLLTVASRLLGDDSSRNDILACPVLNTFILQVTVKAQRGRLTPAQADYILGAVHPVTNGLGCRVWL